jgi:hypothetical protein
MSSIDPELADIVLGIAGPDIASAVVARLGGEFAAPEPRRSYLDEVMDHLTGRGDGVGTRPRILFGFASGDDPGESGDDPEERARRGDLADDEIQHLLDLDEPGVDARLFVNPRVDDTERRRMLAGIRRDGRQGPVAAQLLDLLWSADIHRVRRWFSLAFASGDPEVALAIVGRVELRTEAGRLRLITAVWSRNGRDAARRVLDAASFSPDAKEAFGKALESADGLDELRQRLAAEEDPRHIVRFLHELYEEPRVAQLTAEGGALPWDELLRAHRENPLPKHLHAALAERPECPRALLLGLLAAGLSDDLDDDAPWLDAALARGDLSPEDVLTHARPACRSLTLLTSDEYINRRARWNASTPRAAAGELFHERLAERTEAWAVAIRLLPEFFGSVPELLGTAVASTVPRKP